MPSRDSYKLAVIGYYQGEERVLYLIRYNGRTLSHAISRLAHSARVERLREKYSIEIRSAREEGIK